MAARGEEDRAMAAVVRRVTKVGATAAAVAVADRAKAPTVDRAKGNVIEFIDHEDGVAVNRSPLPWGRGEGCDATPAS
jgi:hypothetical protein